jgi:hypothetical protein
MASNKNNSLNLNLNGLLKEIENGVDNSSLQNTKDKTIEFFIENYILVTGIFIATVILLILFFTSKSFRVGRVLDRMVVIQRYQEITNFPYSRFGNAKLCDCKIASSYNSAHGGYQMYDYISENIVRKKLQCGVRYFEFNVFNSEYGEKAYPVVSNGYKKGEWKLTLNNTPLEFCFETIAKNAFSMKNGNNGVDNPEDPIFIGLNLNTNNNIDCLDILSDIIIDYFQDRLLGGKYLYTSYDNDIHNITMAELIGKVVIFSSDGYQGSGLEELINYCWDNPSNNPDHKMQRLHHLELEKPSYNYNRLINFNKKGLTIVVPHQEGDFYSSNYNPNIAFKYGCQFVAMDMQTIDINLDSYITTFKKNSIILKPKQLRSSYKTRNN